VRFRPSKSQPKSVNVHICIAHYTGNWYTLTPPTNALGARLSCEHYCLAGARIKRLRCRSDVLREPRRHHDHVLVEGQAAGMGRHSPGHVCRCTRQQHSHGNRSCSQPCRHQQDQQQPTIRNSQFQSSVYRDSRHLALSGSRVRWSRILEDRRLTSPETPWRVDHVPAPAVYQWLCK